jgi:Flp pilus assembly protein TadG
MPHRQEHTRAFARDGGAAAVEFAIVSLLFFYLVFGVLQYGFYFFQLQSGGSAARYGARLASVGIPSPGIADCTAFRNAVKDQVGTVSPADITVQLIFAPTPPVIGGSATVVVTYPITRFGFPFVPLPGDTIATQATARVEQVKTTSCLTG